MSDHTSDAQLLAVVDDEPSATSDLRAHIDTCADCQARLARLGEDSALVRRLLTGLTTPALDVAALRRAVATPPSPPRWRRPIVIQIATALAVATAAAASVGPIRSMIERREPRPVAPAPPPNGKATAAPAPTPTAISFALVGSELTVRFDSVPAAGRLDVERTDAAAATAEAVVEQNARYDTMIVLPGELRIRNDRTSRGSYRILVPGSIVRLRVIVAGRMLLDSSPRRTRIGLSDRVGQ